MTPARIVLADDHAMFRAGVRALLDAIPGACVVAEAEDGRTLINLLRTEQADLVLLDIAMPGLNGLQVLERLRSLYPGVRVIMLSMHASEEYVLTAMRAGAAGYLLKSSSPAELRRAIECALDGGIYLSPKLSTRVAGYLRRNGGDDDLIARLLGAP